MDAAREDRLERLFEKATAMIPEQRSAFLHAACDPNLRSQLEQLLADAAEAHDFVDQVVGPAVAGCASGALGGSQLAVDDADPRLGDDIGHFRVLEKLGGGMGVVYKALDVRLGRTVALKFLPSHLGADDEAKQRFIREAKAASALDHPNICAIHEIGETDAGQLYIAMAHYDGLTLKQKIGRGLLPVDEALGVFAQVAEGLRRAHEAGIVHRDMKPANVMITDRGQVKIVDFGLAKMGGADITRERRAMGTIAYMSPEQTRGTDIDARTDIWSLGVVLHEMLTGQQPFRADCDETLVYAIRHDDPIPVRDVRAEIPTDVATVVSRCLDKNLTSRYQNAAELLGDVRAIEAQAIAREIQVQLTPQEEARFTAAARQVNPEAFALYLQAFRLPGEDRYFDQRRAYLEQAIEKDSTFALAYVSLSRSYIMNVHDKPKAEWAIAKALSLDPSLSAAYDALGLLRMWMDWDWPAAKAALERSIELNPNNGRAHHELGQLLMREGRCDAAVPEERRATVLEPFSALFQSGIAEVYRNCRRYDEAVREFEKGFDVSRDSGNVYWNLGETYFHQGQYQKALSMYERMRGPPPGWAYVPLGSRTQALQQVRALRADFARGKATGWDCWALARLYTTLGDRAEAITWLERAYEERAGIVVYLKVEPHFDSIRGEPRFQALLKKIGLDS